ncbi:cytochrome c oxidase assembly factor CtaG [Paenibacillus woosongensis]|uniref:Cytochrome c oxidase assembly factor CtaG n=1 Tax=Paenibacillus woosongensis TaxID=307580 RepID=A0AA95L244_9BACL|nr:cytochrome c oxidase assembly factor CtaG [Paenibacillus woosongensis]WHX49811.1 cytochrome c oxidase assembly factor CtaG [Paenibacillus woosongensis]
MLGLQYFSFSDAWSPVFMSFMLLITAGYFLIVGPLSEKFPHSEPTSAGRKVMFVAGMFLMHLAQGGPVNLLGHTMFSFHMLSMALSYIVAPPLLMLGIPPWIWRSFVRFFERTPLEKLKFMVHPVVSAVLFNGLFSIYHLPVVHDYVMLNFGVHRLYYVVLFIAAVLMWWTFVSPIPERATPQGLKKLGFIYLNMVLLTPACGLIIFASEPLYATYSDPNIWAQAMGYCVPGGDPAALLSQFGGPEFFGFLETRVDQQVGGILMKFIQELIFASMLAYVFFQWYRQENKEDEEDELIADVPPHELNQA